ncbi:hypothetical protein GQ457_11G019280 [Hibiscus cannabinus]
MYSSSVVWSWFTSPFGPTSLIVYVAIVVEQHFKPKDLDMVLTDPRYVGAFVNWFGIAALAMDDGEEKLSVVIFSVIQLAHTNSKS